MSVDPDTAAAEVSECGLVGHAVEPQIGRIADQSSGTRCLNCGAPLSTSFCGNCGQSAHVHKTIASIGHDLLHGLFHFESKIWRTLRELLLRPGQLTRRYIAGERAKFVSPLALFLFSVFLLLADFASVGGPVKLHTTVVRNGKLLSQAEVLRDLQDANVRTAQLQHQLAELPSGDKMGSKLRAELRDEQADAEGLAAAEQINRGLPVSATLKDVHPATGWTALDRRINEAAADPPLLAVRLEANAHKFAWAIIPMSVPFLWLAFAWRREYRLYDHTIFISYALCAVMLLFVAMSGLSALGMPTAWALIIIPVHQYRQLRGAYDVSRIGALWRAAWLQVSALIVLNVFAVILLASGLMA